MPAARKPKPLTAAQIAERVTLDATVIPALNDQQLVEQYDTVRTERLRLDREARKLDEVENAMEEQLIRRMVANKAGALATLHRLVKLHIKDVPTAKDWAKTREYIVANNAWDILQNRLVSTAIVARWEAGEQVPGIEKFPKHTVSISTL